MPAPRKKENISVANRLGYFDRLPHVDNCKQYYDKHAKTFHEKRERNEQIVRDYLNDMPITDLVVKYRISSSRIYEILRRYRQEDK